mmetsp:Transcript_28771/g.40425  ORF Transcript_28771/g.40425 Transcript_28771/m.40425 type:complete len:221 (+) Transcript_28771:688-1350(+)
MYHAWRNCGCRMCRSSRPVGNQRGHVQECQHPCRAYRGRPTRRDWTGPLDLCLNHICHRKPCWRSCGYRTCTSNPLVESWQVSGAEQEAPSPSCRKPPSNLADHPFVPIERCSAPADSGLPLLAVAWSTGSFAGKGRVASSELHTQTEQAFDPVGSCQGMLAVVVQGRQQLWGKRSYLRQWPFPWTKSICNTHSCWHSCGHHKSRPSHRDENCRSPSSIK